MKTTKRKYFVGTKKLKHVKLYEDFYVSENEKPDVNPAGEPFADDEEGPDYYELTDGRFLILWEEPFDDMAGETNYFYRYQVGPAEDARKGNYAKFKDVQYKDVEKLLSPEDRKQHEEERKRLSDDNADRSDAHVK